MRSQARRRHLRNESRRAHAVRSRPPTSRPHGVADPPPRGPLGWRAAAASVRLACTGSGGRMAVRASSASRSRSRSRYVSILTTDHLLAIHLRRHWGVRRGVRWGGASAHHPQQHHPRRRGGWQRLHDGGFGRSERMWRAIGNGRKLRRRRAAKKARRRCRQAVALNGVDVWKHCGNVGCVAGLRNACT